MHLFCFFLFILGLHIGSFLNVVIDRISKNQSIIFPPSHCPHCRHHLAWYDLVPLLSYALLKGKCRYCHEHISLYYPGIELLTGFLFVMMYLSAGLGNVVYLLYLLAITSIFIVVFFTDYKYGIIPVYPVLIGSIIISIYLWYATSLSVVGEHYLSGAIAFCFFMLLYLFTKGRGMGFGDVMLVFLLGLFLGYPGVIVALYIAFLSGAAVSLLLIASGTKKFRHDTIPFGPFLIAGSFASFFWSDMLVTTILNFMMR